MVHVGHILRDAREARGLSYEDVERETRVALRYLVAMENDDLEALPASVYARGFLRAYARFLDLDPAPLLAGYSEPEWTPAAQIPAFSPQERVRVTTPRVAIIALTILVLAALGGASVVGLIALSGDDSASATAPDASRNVPADNAGGRILPLEVPTGEVRPRTVDAPAVQAVSGSTVPDFRGGDIKDALATLSQLGLPYFVVQMHSDRVDAGKVLQQTPRPGARIDKKTSVTLVVSLGGAFDAPVTTPTVPPSASVTPATN